MSGEVYAEAFLGCEDTGGLVQTSIGESGGSWYAIFVVNFFSSCLSLV